MQEISLSAIQTSGGTPTLQHMPQCKYLTESVLLHRGRRKGKLAFLLKCMLKCLNVEINIL